MLGVAGLAALLLTACGNLIPDQQVTNPLGLDGTAVQVEFQAPDVLTAQAIGAQAEADFSFSDYDLPDLPISPTELANELSVASATLSGDTATAPDTIDLSDVEVTVRIWHGAFSYDAAEEDARVEAVVEAASDITLNRVSCDAGVSCEYAYVGAVPAFGVASLTGGQLGTTMTIVTEAPEPNQGHVLLQLTGEPDELAGRTLTITIDASEGKIGF